MNFVGTRRVVDAVEFRVSRRSFVSRSGAAIAVGLLGGSAGRLNAGFAIEDERLDLAAVVLRPEDVADGGWVHDGAFHDDLAAVARSAATYLGDDVTPGAVSVALERAGWRRFYSSSMSLASEGVVNRRIRSYVTEYASAEGASAGFAFLENERAVSTAGDVEGVRPIGDEFEVTADRGESASEGRPYRSLDLTFRVGAVVAGVNLIVYGEDADEPELALVEQLGQTLHDRIVEPPSGDRLGATTLRLAPGDGDVVTYDDAYYRLQGVDLSLSGEDPDATSARTATYGAASNVYQLWQGAFVGTESGFLYGVTQLAFLSAAAAATWLEGMRATLSANPFYGRLESVPDSPEVGEQAVALRYSPGGGNEAPRSILLAVRASSRVTRVHLVPQGRIGNMPLSAAVWLANQGLNCVERGSCDDFTPVGPELLPPGA